MTKVRAQHIASLLRVPRPSVTLSFGAFGFGLRSNRDRKREKVDKALGVLRIVAAHGEAGEVGAIQGVGRETLGDVEGALPELEAN